MDGMHEVKVGRGEETYPVYVGGGSLLSLPALLEETLDGAHPDLFIVTDRTVARHYLRPLSSACRRAGFPVRADVLPSGESTKSPKHLFALLSRMVREGLSRESLVVALGGGVIGDLAGFAAAVYMRGCGLVQVPTTLLAQIDSSIGGKTGVNLPEGKNLVGAFHNPLLTVIDPEALRTLPSRELFAGFAELLKYGLIFNEDLFGGVEKSFLDRFDGAGAAGLGAVGVGAVGVDDVGEWILADEAALTERILRSVKIKADIVTADERERGLRMILNFGHTFGHALEQITRYRRFLHGEAVYLGMGMATRLSSELGLLDPGEAERVQRILTSLPLPDVRGITPRGVLRQMARDKKVRGGRLHLVVLEKIGYAQVTSDVGREMILRSVREILNERG